MYENTRLQSQRLSLFIYHRMLYLILYLSLSNFPKGFYSIMAQISSPNMAQQNQYRVGAEIQLSAHGACVGIGIV